MKFLISSRK